MRAPAVITAAFARCRDFVVVSTGPGRLLVDAGEEFDQQGIRWWQLVENPDRVGIWDHLPSGTSGQLGEMLLGIAVAIEDGLQLREKS